VVGGFDVSMHHDSTRIAVFSRTSVFSDRNEFYSDLNLKDFNGFYYLIHSRGIKIPDLIQYPGPDSLEPFPYRHSRASTGRD
jgi:hypothetical protein